MTRISLKTTWNILNEGKKRKMSEKRDFRRIKMKMFMKNSSSFHPGKFSTFLFRKKLLNSQMKSLKNFIKRAFRWKISSVSSILEACFQRFHHQKFTFYLVKLLSHFVYNKNFMQHWFLGRKALHFYLILSWKSRNFFRSPISKRAQKYLLKYVKCEKKMTIILKRLKAKFLSSLLRFWQKK